MHVRTNHPLQLFTPKSQPELPNDRLVILRWKGNEKTGRVAHSARCFSVPKWEPQLTGIDVNFIDMLIEAVEQRQMLAAHKYVTNMLEVNGGVCNDIPNSIVAPQTILMEFEQEQSESDGSRGKLSSVQIATWFTEKLSDIVKMAVADKKGWLDNDYQMTEAEEKKLEQTANGYRATLEKLAAPQPRVNIETATALKKALDLLPLEAQTNDTIARKINKKLDMILSVSEEIGLDAL